MEINLFERGDRDFNKALTGCIFKVDGRIFRLEALSSLGDSCILKGVVLDRLSKVWTPHSFSFSMGNYPELDISFPDMGYINYKGGIVYAMRTAARQWSIAYNKSVITIIDGFAEERKLAGLTLGGYLAEKGEFVDRLYSRRFFSFKDAVEAVSSGERLGAAINKYVAIAQTIFSESLIVMYKGNPVGYVDSAGRAFIYSAADYVVAVCPFNVEVVQ